MKTINLVNRRLLTVLFSLSFILVSASTDAASNSLWKVLSGTNTLYLQGSVHLLKQENYPLSDAIETAYSNSAMVAFEADLDALSDHKTAVQIRRAAALPKGTTLRGSLKRNTYSLLADRMTQMKLDPDAVAEMKPWLVAVTLSVVKLQSLGYSSDHGLDRHFYNRAVADRKQRAYLETPEIQIRALNSLSDEDPDSLVLQSIRELDTIEAGIGDIVKAWKTGDAARLSDELLKSFKEFPKVHATLVVERNRRWAPQIETWLKSGRTCFVVVGCMHLVGDDSVIAILKKKGYTIQQL